MRALLLPLLACTGLAGCAVYPDPYYGGYGYGYGYPQTSIDVYSSPSYYGSYPAHRPRGHGHDHGYSRRDTDRDGVPDRADLDRDNDGVPNRHDARPNNPRRR